MSEDFNFRYHLRCITVLCTMMTACSTVRHLPADELLYTGTRGITVSDVEQAPLHEQAVSEARVAFVAPPNNALLGSSRYRAPLPLGLWAYNAFVNDSTRLGRWFFRTFASQPIYISTVNPTLRVDVAENTLRGYGYFDNSVTYAIDTLRDKRKARLSYTLHLGEAWRYGEISYKGFPPVMDSLIHSTWGDQLLREGEQLSYSSLSGERSRLFTLFREQGYYYYRPEMTTILADTTRMRGLADLRITPSTDLPAYIARPWHVGHTYLSIRHTPREQLTDTLNTEATTYLYQGRRIPIRSTLLSTRIAYRPGDLYSTTSQNATQRDLNRLGILSGVNIHYQPRDSTLLTDTLDVYINALLEPTYELSLEANLTAKTNGQVGPGIVTSLSMSNLLRMAEVIQLRLRGSYEWQTRPILRREGTVSNSFEMGADLSTSVPQLLFPGGYDYPYKRPVSTTARLYANWLHRGGLFRVLAFGGNLTYAFSTSENVSHSINPFALTYNTLEHTTQRFDSLMKANPAIGYSFRDQFIPSGSYTITFDNTRNSTIQEGNIVGHKPTSRMSLTLTSAGAFTSLLYAATGQSTGEKGQSLFGTPYAQFVKAHSEVCHYFPLASQHTLATRLAAGILHAYGNSTVAPFGEQFHVGGASDLRAFPLRSIGPGSYRSTERYAYIEHTGDFKLEANIEWRFPLARQLSGALFIDVGNVWLLHPDASRPGGEFRWKTLGRDLALGTGLGLRYNLRVLLLRADVGIPLHTPYDTGKRGYYNIPHFTRGLCFHFGIGYPF